MAENTERSFKDFTPLERQTFKNNLRETKEVLELQADIAKARADLQKYSYEELVYAIKIFEIKNPKEIKTEANEPEKSNTPSPSTDQS